MAFKYKRKLTFTNSGFEVFTNFPVLIIIDDSAGAYPLLTAADEVEFRDSDAITVLDWECAEFNDGGKSYYFVRCENIAASDTDYIYMYYGNDTSIENKVGVWDGNYKAVYHMKDETIGTILDSTSNNFDGTKKDDNQPIEAAGDIGKCQDFDGAFDFIDCGDVDVLLDLTVEVYCYFPDSDTTRTLVAKDDNNAYRVRVESAAGNDRMWALINDGLGFGTGIGADAIPVDQNDYLAWTFDASEADVVFFYNSTRDHLADVGKNSIANTAGPLYLGKTKTWGEPFDDKIYEIRISDKIRSDNYVFAQDKILRQQDYITFGEQKVISTGNFFIFLSEAFKENKKYFKNKLWIPNSEILVPRGI